MAVLLNIKICRHKERYSTLILNLHWQKYESIRQNRNSNQRARRARDAREARSENTDPKENYGSIQNS
jgi:hypothetical protein